MSNNKRSVVDSRLRYRKSEDQRRRLAERDRDDDLMMAIVSDLAGSMSRYRLTPDRLVQVISDADAGDPREQAALFATILEKEPALAAHLQTRRLAVLSKPWRVQSETQPDLADQITKELSRAGMQKAMSWLLDAIGFGYAGVVVDWLPGGAGVTGFQPVSSDRWLFDEGGNPALTGADGRPIPLCDMHPAQVIYMVNDFKTGLPCRTGLLRTLLWTHLFKNSAWRDWNRFLERFGMPFLLGKIPSGDFNDAQKRMELMRSLMSVRSGGSGIGTIETQMDMLNGGSGGNNDAYERHQRYSDEIMTLVVLGQLASSDRGSGLSQGGMQEEVRQDILEADCAMLMEVVQNRLVDWLCRLRHGLEDTDDMRFVIDCKKAEDLNTRADRDEKIARAAGCKLKREYVINTYGVELEEREEAPPLPQPGAAFMPRQGFSDSPGLPGTTRVESRDRIISRVSLAALGRLVDEDALAAWKVPIETAAGKAFGDLDPEDPDLVEKFKARGPAFMASLPGLMDQFDTRAFEDALQGAMLAAFLNGVLPVSFWTRGAPAK